uniref:Uncharacterized protein n=1 Tax=Bursaphelenchus xylophilus TaxID=6326 RepID=A0A1I7SDK9_BURXY
MGCPESSLPPTRALRQRSRTKHTPAAPPANSPCNPRNSTRSPNLHLHTATNNSTANWHSAPTGHWDVTLGIIIHILLVVSEADGRPLLAVLTSSYCVICPFVGVIFRQ